MKGFDKNFHINFSPLYFAFAFMLFMLWASEANADEVEEVLVVGQQEELYETDPVSSNRLISTILPAFTYNPGGYGGFIGYNEKGTQTTHTSVLVNGIPANEPGSGWYNFAHDVVSGEKVKVVSGANSVMYGSGSIAGTVLIQDTIDSGTTVRLQPGGDRYFRVAPVDQIQLVTIRDSMGSVRNDNTERDSYEMNQLKSVFEVTDWTFVAKYSDYKYDYDNCYDAVDFSVSNNCLEDGERYNVSVRSDNLTIGRSFVSSEYFTNGVVTYTNESYTDYIRAGDSVQLSNNLSIDYGVDAENLSYKTGGYNDQVYRDENFGAYFQANAEFVLDFNFGVRLGNDKQNALRLGISKGQFFLNVGNSFRKPTLYEKFGDNFVLGNPDLKPEEGIGYELGYGVLSLYRFEFDETIEYQDGFVMGDVFVSPQYFNAGKYTSHGLKYNQIFGPVKVMVMFNDTDQPRAPKYSSSIEYNGSFENFDLNFRYAINMDRLPSEFDVVAEGQRYLEDLERLDFSIVKRWEKFTLSFKVQNLLDDVVEIIPYYENDGREFHLTMDYNW